jgi:16S rRNA (cytosine1402-N4)-methyltransferase
MVNDHKYCRFRRKLVTKEFSHQSVLPQEVITGLAIAPGEHYLDVTLGGGGHTRLILEAGGKVTAIDRDRAAIEHCQSLLQEYTDQLHFWQGNFVDYQPGTTKFTGLIADLGVSSYQLDEPSRGFSFRLEAELDMRMDQTQELTAKTVINTWSEKQLADIFFKYGEERLSRRLAKIIVEERPFQTTTKLAETISKSVPRAYRYGRIHPATRIFQALRIVVNQELASLEKFLQVAPHWLQPQGRIAIISFHSLEDRIVKHSLRENPLFQVLTKKPIIPQEAEMKLNPRSRSAKLRLAEKL